MPIDFDTMNRAFTPKTVAIFGDKKASGFMWLNGMRNFKGNLYSIQLDPKEIPLIEEMGVKNFTSLEQVPEHIDYAVVAVPRKFAPLVVADCIKHKVGAVTLFTAGYAETATQDGKDAQAELLKQAQDGGLMLLGPNCMGLHNPSAGVCFFPAQPTYDGGRVGVSSQSGSHANALSMAAPDNGLPITKMISFGNGIVLENADYLDFFSQDPETEAIIMYIESLRDGPRFFKLLREVAPKKPVLIWKGGQTEDGKRATASHTAALAESMAIWHAAARQAGAIMVNSMDEATDTLKALLYLPKFTGDGCGLTGGAGGQSVSITDAFSKAGMRVPAISKASSDKLGEFFSLVGASYGNPIDMGSNRTEIDTIMDILAADPLIDIMVMQMGVMSANRGQSALDAQIEALIRIRDKAAKPVLAIPHSATPLQHAEMLQKVNTRLQDAGIPTFPSYERAALALKNTVDYHRAHAG